MVTTIEGRWLGHSKNQPKFNVTGDGMNTEEKFEQFHKAHPRVYPAFVKAAHRMMYMKRGRLEPKPFAAWLNTGMGWCRLQTVSMLCRKTSPSIMPFSPSRTAMCLPAPLRSALIRGRFSRRRYSNSKLSNWIRRWLAAFQQALERE
jgi:hypothetical protein